MTRKSHSSEPSRIRWKHFSEQTSKTLSEMHKLHLLKHLPDWLEFFRSFRKFREQGVEGIGQRLKQMYELRKFTKDPVTAAKQVLTLIQKKRNVWYGTVGISLPRKQEANLIVWTWKMASYPRNRRWENKNSITSLRGCELKIMFWDDDKNPDLESSSTICKIASAY